MYIPFVDLSTLHAPIKSTILQTVDQMMDSGVVMGGEVLTHFEEAFARYIGTNYCIACGNGTDALEIILRALNISAPDEVIVPANGWMSAAEAVRLVGATPVFVDSHPDTYHIDASQIETHITDRTRAIIPVHLYGMAVDLTEVNALARTYDLKVIEDCAQAHGAAWGHRKVGSLGDVAAFSFYPTKNLGALGDGGAILTQDATLANTLRSIANHGQTKRDHPRWLGRNSRMDALQAAILSLKLPYLDQWNQQRRRLAERYQQQLADIPLQLPDLSTAGRHVHHLYVIRSAHRKQLQQHLTKHRIVTQIHYPHPVPKLAPFRMLPSAQEPFPVATQQAVQLLSLPLHPAMSTEAVDYVCHTLKTAWR